MGKASERLALSLLLDDIKCNLAVDIVCIDDDKHPAAKAKAALIRRINQALKKIAVSP